MVQARCIQKFRDKNNSIKGYLLEDCNGQQLRVTPDQLKMAIFSKQIEITNLTLTKDSRLVDRAESTIYTKNTSTRDIRFEVFCERMKKIPALVFNTDKEAEEYANSTKATKTIEYIIESLSDLLGEKMKKFSFCNGTYDNSNRYFTCGGLQFYLWFTGWAGSEYRWTIGYNGEDLGNEKFLGACEDMYKDTKSINENYEIVKELWQIVEYKPVPLYELALYIFETTSKFTDTKYATVGRYVVADDMRIGQEVCLSQRIKYKMYKKNSGCLQDVNIEAPLIDITLYPLDCNNQYIVDIQTSTDFEQYTGRNGERLICGRAHYSGGNLTNFIIGNSIEYKIDMYNKNWKKELKLVLEQEFKKAYHNLRIYLDREGL